MPRLIGEASPWCSKGAPGQGAARGGAGVWQRCLRQGTTGAAHARRFPADLHREGEVCSLQSQKSGGFLQRRKRAVVCKLLPAAALSPVRRWSHSLDPMRISGKQKSCCSPSPIERRLVADGPQRPGDSLGRSQAAQGLPSALLDPFPLWSQWSCQQDSFWERSPSSQNPNQPHDSHQTQLLGLAVAHSQEGHPLQPAQPDLSLSIPWGHRISQHNTPGLHRGMPPVCPSVLMLVCRLGAQPVCNLCWYSHVDRALLHRPLASD